MPVHFRCPHCGRQTHVPDEYVGQSGPCAGCGKTICVAPTLSPFGAQPSGPKIGDDPTVRMLLPVGRSPLAIIAGYMGLLALLGIFAPIALILGIVAIHDIQKNPEKRGMGRAIFAVVMGVLCTIGFIVGIVAAGMQ